MANSAFDHTAAITVPGSSTNTAIVTWTGTGADTFGNSTILVGSTTMGLAADTDLLTFGNGTLAITGAVTGVTALTASGAVTGGTLAGTVSTATQNSITTMTGLTTVGTVGTGVWNGTAIAQAYIGAEAINESKMQVSNAPTNGYVLTARDGVTGGFTWEAAAGGGAALTGSTDNTIVTVTGANAIQGESTLTYTGTAMMIGLAASPPTPDHTSVHIWEGSAGSLTSSTDMQLVVENSGNAGIAIMSPNANTTQLAFGSPQDNRQGGLLYNHNTNALELRASGVTRAILTSTYLTMQANTKFGIEHTTNGTVMNIKNTTSAGTAANGFIRWQDQNNAQIGYIGYGSSNGTFQIHSEQAAAMTFATSGYARLTIASNGTFSGSASNDISDQRIKENIEEATVGLAEILQLRPVKYNFMAGKGWGEPGQKYYGFLAQEVEAIIPEAVMTADIDIDDEQGGKKRDPNGIRDLKSVTMTQITTALVKAVQELKAEVDALKG